ncbi:MAG: hypothetical protein FWB74_05055, partial [Defluviitaleaceae bacterium]|nr:hypothetical protein [Defluviitaleaceae bacterium]
PEVYETSSFEAYHPPPKPNPCPKPCSKPCAKALFVPENIVNIFPDFEPKTRWVTTTLIDLHTHRIYDYSASNNAFIIENEAKYRHVLLGQNEKGFVIGVPDIVRKGAPPQKGFDTFKPCYPSTEQPEETHGYWIMQL